ncbi:WXG100 family type VII secretion target [Nocardia huaxiensis]|uniref:WXG100 family type VII secretion target n=1 Tax=Nocardia huaxiensis TaxID=2755382 RepID=A0A7D6VAP3_9NOCA|nr:WXG100 family type VII secretion target [Nocardia huaxiensis]QLY31861.1 WXG100 family type VII secretion target [Nocardia huaxiensis]UFS95425.1 WXG100 family type VII secretion target [Nocardia huaxiensis]
MSKVQHDAAGGSKAEGDMANAVEGMRWTIKQITDEVEAARGWAGAARGKFNEAANAWKEEADRLNGILNRITQQVGAGNVQYKRMDQEGEDAFSYIRI